MLAAARRDPLGLALVPTACLVITCRPAGLLKVFLLQDLGVSKRQCLKNHLWQASLEGCLCKWWSGLLQHDPALAHFFWLRSASLPRGVNPWIACGLPRGPQARCIHRRLGSAAAPRSRHFAHNRRKKRRDTGLKQQDPSMLYVRRKNS